MSPGTSARRLCPRSAACRAAAVVVVGVVLLLTGLPAAPAWAHGVQGRAETPVPLELFFAAAGLVVVLSFVGLGLAWSRPRWQQVRWRPAPAPLSALVLSPALVGVLRALVLLGLLGVVVAGAFGSTLLNRNIAPLSVFVLWWIGLVPLTLLLGDVWRELNPWAVLARLLGARPDTGRYPARWGLWPAVLLLVVWSWLELVYPTAAEPRLLAAVVVAYSLLTVGAMRTYGVDTWLDHGEAFSVYTRLLATLSPVEVRTRDGDRRLGLRPPVVGATQLRASTGLVAFVSVLIGAVTFDGFSGTRVWLLRDVAATERLIELGLPPFAAGIVVATVGLLLALALVAGLFEGAAAWADRRGDLRGRGTRSTPAFAHSLLPIALGYAAAHSLTLFVFQSQDLLRLASDPLGRGSDLFGTADRRIDFDVLSPNAIWAFQLVAIVGAHVVGLVLAHDRALELAGTARAAVRSQLPFLLLMVTLTVSALWLLSEGMTGTPA